MRLALVGQRCLPSVAGAALSLPRGREQARGRTHAALGGSCPTGTGGEGRPPRPDPTGAPQPSAGLSPPAWTVTGCSLGTGKHLFGRCTLS